jgi:hypothetical protein
LAVPAGCVYIAYAYTYAYGYRHANTAFNTTYGNSHANTAYGNSYTTELSAATAAHGDTSSVSSGNGNGRRHPNALIQVFNVRFSVISLGLAGGAGQVEGQEALQDLLVAEVGGPAVGVEDRLIERRVDVV